MNSPNLFVKVEGLQVVDMRLALAIGVSIKGVQRDLLPARGLLLRDGLARGGIEQIAPLAGQALEVVGHVRGRQVGRRKPGVRLGLLFLPARVEQFNYLVLALSYDRTVEC